MNRGDYHRGLKRAGGFSLLEIVFVLALVAVLVTWLTISISTVETEDRLRESIGEVELMTKRARNIAVRQQRPYQLVIEEGRLSMAPLHALGKVENDNGENEQNRFQDVRASKEVDKEVLYEIRRWGTDEWIRIEKDEKVVMTIDPVGLVEPIAIRCSVGKSWIKQELHPLTAAVRDEEMSVREE